MEGWLCVCVLFYPISWDIIVFIHQITFDQFHRQAVNLEDNIEYFVLFHKQAVNLEGKMLVKFLNYIHCTWL